MNKFAKAKNKRAYSYLLKGLKKKIRLAEAFIEIKKGEYEALQETLKQDEE